MAPLAFAVLFVVAAATPEPVCEGNECPAVVNTLLQRGVGKMVTNANGSIHTSANATPHTSASFMPRRRRSAPITCYTHYNCDCSYAACACSRKCIAAGSNYATACGNLHDCNKEVCTKDSSRICTAVINENYDSVSPLHRRRACQRPSYRNLCRTGCANHYGCQACRSGVAYKFISGTWVCTRDGAAEAKGYIRSKANVYSGWESSFCCDEDTSSGWR